MSGDADTSGTWRRLDPEIEPAARLEGIRVLAVEDQPDMLESLRRTLEDHGATVTAVPTGRVAFDLLRERPRDFDVCVSDIGMPDMDGYELLRKVRGELGLSAAQLPAVAITAYARDEDRLRALRAGFQAHVVKPYQVSHLLKTLDAVRRVPAATKAAAGQRAAGVDIAL